MIKYLEKTGEINFDKIFNQRLGYLLFKDFCLNVVQEQVPAYFNGSNNFEERKIGYST